MTLSFHISLNILPKITFFNKQKSKIKTMNYLWMVDGLIQKKALMTALGTALLVASIATLVFAKYLNALSRQMQTPMQTPMPSPAPYFPPGPRLLSVDEANRIIERSTHPFSASNADDKLPNVVSKKRFVLSFFLPILILTSKNGNFAVLKNLLLEFSFKKFHC